MKKESWKWILFIGMMIVIIPLIIYQEINLDENLSNSNKWKQVQINLEKELKEIKLPPHTLVNQFENNSRQRTSVFLKMRYLTTLEDSEFVAYMSYELKKRGWIYYGKDQSYESLQFCRGKFDATLSHEPRGLLGNGGNYYQLYFILRSRAGTPVPQICK